MKVWTSLRYITKNELREINELKSIWGSYAWRLRASRELVRNYDLEAERQAQM